MTHTTGKDKVIHGADIFLHISRFEKLQDINAELLEALKKVEGELLHILNAQEFTANGQESKYCQFTMNKVMQVFEELTDQAIAKAEGREA